MQTATRQLAAFVAGLEYTGLPPDVVDSAKLHALDALGCGIAAYALDAAPWARSDDTGPGPATALGFADRLAPESAAFINGTLFHALDYDDSHPDASMHVSAVVVPAVFAVAQQIGARGRDVLAAIVAGYETAVRIGDALRDTVHGRGLDATSAYGVFGATAAAARLRRLDAEHTARAFGIAANIASEFLAGDTRAAPLRAGWAAQAGVTAARLAGHDAGVPAPTHDGLFAAALDEQVNPLAAELATLGRRWATRGIAYRAFPACHEAHAPLTALASLIDEHGIDAYDVTSIVAISDRAGAELVLAPLEAKRRPRTPRDAKFSLPYCLAALLVHGRLGPDDFTVAALNDPAVITVAGRVTAELREYPATGRSTPGGVRVATRYGQSFEIDLLHPRGAIENPMTRADIVAKWRTNAALALSPAAIHELERAVLGLERELSPLEIVSEAARRRPGVASVS